MYDFVLSIKVGDGINSFYKCEIKDGRNREVLSETPTTFKQKKEVCDWVKNNLPPLWIKCLDSKKIDVGKIKEKLKN